MRTLSDEDVDALATAVARKVKTLPAGDPFDLFTRREAATYCSLSPSSFERERRRVPDALKPAAAEGPLATRWHRCVLDIYKATGGAVVRRRPGRPKK